MAIGLGIRIGLALSCETGFRERVELRDIPAVARRCESIGLDAFFIAPSTSTRSAVAGPDPFVVLGACAAETSTVQLGSLATPLDERAPSLLAKVVTGLDVCSSSRAVLVVQGPKPDDNDPGGLKRLGEALEVARALVRLPSPSFSGTYYRLHDAWNEPKAIRVDGAIPIGLFIGGSAPTDEHGDLPVFTRSLVDTAVRLAEYCFIEAQETEYVSSVAKLVRAGARPAGRLPGTIQLVGLVPCDQTSDQDGIAEHGRSVIDAGCDGVVMDWRGSPTDPAMLASAKVLRETIATG